MFNLDVYCPECGEFVCTLSGEEIPEDENITELYCLCCDHLITIEAKYEDKEYKIS